MGDRRTAFDRFARAVEINRNDYRSYYEIGVIFNDMGKQADAQIVLDNSLRIKPDFTPASELLAVVLCAQNKYDEAINVYKDAIRYYKKFLDLKSLSEDAVFARKRIKELREMTFTHTNPFKIV